MKIELKHRGQSIGEVFATIASTTTKELRGLIIPNYEYQKIRSFIKKYDEIFLQPKSKTFIDSILDSQIRKKYSELNVWYNDFQITVDDEPIMNQNSVIRIIDNLTKTGLGNIELSIEAWNLNTDIISKKFKTYSIEYMYPSTPNRVIQIKYNDQIILKH